MNKEDLISFFSAFWSVDPDKVVDDLKLNDKSLKNQTSIRLYQFLATVESKFNVQINNLNKIVTFGDLITNIQDKGT
ncbi:MAG: hypothetical protein WCW57_04225 [Candidatus Pacearchaeota archaeon]|jgi:acyl carrier protein